MLKRKLNRLLVMLLTIGLFIAYNQYGGFQDQFMNASYTPHNLQKKIPRYGVKVHFIQLTNGEATFLRLENEKTILIDTGSHSSLHQVMTYLEEQKVEQIDSLVITNDTDEHAGNLLAILDAYEVNRLYFSHSLQSYIQKLKISDKTELHPLTKNQNVSFDSNVVLHVLHPGEDLSTTPQDNSLVFQLEIGKNVFLFTSDISEVVEKQLVQEFDVHSHILKVSDFGSNQASHPDFITKVDAHIAVVFHRPDFYFHPDVVERLEESWMDVYALKKHGHLLIVAYEDDYDVYILEPSKAFHPNG